MKEIRISMESWKKALEENEYHPHSLTDRVRLLSGHNVHRDHMARKAKNVYYLTH